jgi:GT2 family glycosyltransferase
MARISIIIPVYEGWSTLDRCLQHLAQNTFQDFRVLVVSHGPGGNKNIHASESLEILHLEASSDLWWAGATNVGIRKALEYQDSDFIMLLNHDCFLDQAAIATLLESTESTNKSIVAPIQIDSESNKTLVRTAYTAYLFGFPTVIPPPGQRRNNYPALSRTGLITGGRGVLIPRDVFNSVGLLDEKSLPHYGADNDFFLRCKAAGYQLFVANNAKVYVDASKTTTAAAVSRLSFRQFLATFSDRRSHRNIPDLLAHFKKHYPIPGLYLLGVSLNILRYVVTYSLTRPLALFRHE